MIFGESGDFLGGWGEVGIARGAVIRVTECATSNYRRIVYGVS